jgi:hypothetical protein
MPEESGWGRVQDTAYHLERSVVKALNAFLLVGAGLVPQGRTVLREAGEWLVLAQRDVEALAVKGTKQKAARAKVLKILDAAAKKGTAVAKLLFQEKVPDKVAAEICSGIAAQIEHEMEALEGLLALR